MGESSNMTTLPPGRTTRTISDRAFPTSGMLRRLNPAVAQTKLSSANGRESASPAIMVTELDIPRVEALEFARETIEEESGKPLVLPAKTRKEETGTTPATPPLEVDGKTLIARDAKKNPLLSTCTWSEDAVQRVFRVPAGFMRNRTQDRIEKVAADRGITAITLEVVEAGIEYSRQLMAQMVESYQAKPEISRQEMAEEKAGKTAAGKSSNSGTRKDENREMPTPMNEVGVMSAMRQIARGEAES